jgi:predicted outer membrane repeat protein
MLIIFGCNKEESVNPADYEPRPVRVFHIPDEFGTIQEAIDSAFGGDTILVAKGYYSGEGNCNLEFLGKRVFLKSASGPDSTFIDSDGSPNIPNRAFICTDTGDSRAVVEGFTIMNGYTVSGGAVYCLNASPTFIRCIFKNNHATASGGAIWCKSARPKFFNCTIVKNNARTGGCVYVSADATPYFFNCIIAYTDSGGVAETLTGDAPVFKCCNLYGNTGGDWTGIIADQLNTQGNFNANPGFCDADIDDFHLRITSPCTPENNDCAVLIGALSVDCL